MTAAPPSSTETQPLGKAGPGGEDPRLAASVDNWKKKLLDLTKRNRALNFRMNRVSTVAIVDELPAQVFRQLVQDRRNLRFIPAEEADSGQWTVDSEKRAAGEAREVDSGQWPVDGEKPEAGEATASEDAELLRLRGESPSEKPAGAAPQFAGLTDQPGAPSMPGEDAGPVRVPPSPDFIPYDPATLDSRHTDERLQTASTPEQLDRSLRRIDEQARATLEEQGVNALFLALGMLNYLDAPGSKEVFRAPLVLVPVALARKSARAGYTISASEDEPLVNPALVEHLRRMHSLALPELPDSAALPEDYDLQTFFSAVAEAVAGQDGWSVKSDIYLGLFSFQKFVMYKDLEANSAAMVRHRLVRQLVTRANTGAAYHQLPDAVRAIDLDQAFPPETGAQVVDADSSQLRAIAAAQLGHDLVIEGPPGTGKSQTITNLIAQALSENKTVLFVAEKMAALQVVYSRLVTAGLGEFCLELHSTKANKRAVMRELAASLDASLQRPAVPSQSTQRLPGVRDSLSAYARAVHQPHGALGLSPYRVYGRLGNVLDAPRLRYSGPTESVTEAQFEQTVRDLEALEMASQPIGVPAAHPWRDTSRTFYTEDDLAAARDLAAGLAARLDGLASQAETVSAAFGLPLRNFADIESAARLAAVMARSPGAPLAVLSSEQWNAPPPAARALIERGRALAALRAELGQRFTPAVFEQEHAADAAYIEQKSSGLLGFLAALDGRYRAIQKRWRAYRQPGYQASMLEQAGEMRRVDHYRREQAALAAAGPEARQMFGGLWQGEASDWQALESYLAWVVEFRALAVRQSLAGRPLELAARPAPNVSQVEALQARAADARRVFDDLGKHVGWPASLAAEPFAALGARAAALAGGVALGPRWAAFETARARAAGGLAAELLAPAMAGELPFSDLPNAFARAFYQKWLGEVVQAREPLRAFHTLTHEQRVAEFRQLDERVLEENQVALVARLREHVQQQLRAGPAAVAMPFLRREMARQRGLSPLRKTMQHAEAAIRAIKPCFMMSPLSVAQLLDGSQPSFDLVIFDEASQLPPEDAAGAIIRGRQLVVVGDPKQLPPTNFFAVMGGQVTAPLGEDGMPLFDDGESVLEEFMGAGLPTSRLKWHYRSRDESLIAFSNISFYDSDLFTFPSVETRSSGGGVVFDYVADGVYEGNGLNPAEARRVAQAVVEHARTQPGLSLGVGTFNLRQQQAILDELEQARRADPSLEPFFAQKEESSFFVKNLENIQGDERDVIFISVTYARAPDGKLRFNFGPLNTQNGWRRLNVLATRARQQMRVFSSIHGDDINAAATTSAGAHLLRSFLIYAEHGRLDGATAPGGSPASEAADDTFERDVEEQLTARGLRLDRRVGVSGYRIDFGVKDDALPGRYLAGLECDGPAYHAAQTARDRDRLRQQVLEARGWRLLRVWSTDWFKDRAGQVERLLGLVAEAREQAIEEARHEAQARQSAKLDETLAIEEDELEAGEAAPEEDEASASDNGYRRPRLPAYQRAAGESRYTGELLRAPAAQLQRAVMRVVNTEAPLHTSDLAARVAAQWGTRLGARITARILDACAAAERDGLLRLRGDFVWGPSDEVQPRSRRGSGIPPERMAPEEYRAAILLLIDTGQSFTRPDLTNEVRALFGYGRATPALEASVAAQVDALLAEGIAGEGSGGITKRR